MNAALDEIAKRIADARTEAGKVSAMITEVRRDRDRLSVELDAARKQLDLVQPSLDRLTRLSEQQSEELLKVRQQNDGLSESLDAAAEREANGFTGEPTLAGRTPLTRAAEAGAVFFHGSTVDKHRYLRDRGWILQTLGWKDPLGEDGHLIDNAVRLQVRRDVGGFKYMLEGQKAMGAVA